MSLNDEDKKLILTSIGNNIREIRKSKKMTQADLAFILDSDPSKIGRTERGEYDFKISSLTVIAQGLKVGICDIFENIDFN